MSISLSQPQVEVLSEEEEGEEDEEEDILSLAEEKYRPAALEKMIALIALLVEQSRSERCTLKYFTKTFHISPIMGHISPQNHLQKIKLILELLKV